MYVCCDCAAPIRFWSALFSTPANPVACPACGSEQRKPGSGLLFGVLLSLALVAFLLLGFVAAVVFHSELLLGAPMLALTGVLIALDLRSWRRGRLIPVTLLRKRVERTIVWSFLGLVAAGLAFLFAIHWLT